MSMPHTTKNSSIGQGMGGKSSKFLELNKDFNYDKSEKKVYKNYGHSPERC